MKPSSSPLNIRIADLAAQAIIHSEHMHEGVAMQTGSGKISLAVAAQLEAYMLEKRDQRQFCHGRYYRDPG